MKHSSVRRSRSTASERARWSERYERSSLSQREFCSRHSLRLSTLQHWLRQVRAVSSPNNSTTPAFTELKLSPSPPTPRWAAEVLRPNGAVLRLAHDIPSGLLDFLLRAC